MVLATDVFFLKLVQNQILDFWVIFKLIDVTDIRMIMCQYVCEVFMCTVCMGKVRFRCFWVQVVHRTKSLSTGLFARVP